MLICDVIIVNYNTGELLEKVVNSVLVNCPHSKILIIDNNSNDKSMSFSENDSCINKIYRKENYGFASSCNYGAKLSKQKYVLFLNPDCLLVEDITPLLCDLEKKENSAIIGCLVTNADGTEQKASRRRLPTLLRAFKTYSKIEKLAKIKSCLAGVNLMHESMPILTIKTEAISGAFILMKKKVFDEINGFDEGYPMHFEDLDLFKRTQNNGYDVLFNPNVKVMHYQGTSSVSNPQVLEYKKQSLRIYFRKHCSYFSSLIINIISRFL